MTVPFRAYFLLGTHLCTEDQGFPLFSVYRRMNPGTILYSLSTAIIYNHLYMMVLLKKAYLDFFSFLLPSHPSQCSTSVALFHISQVQLPLISSYRGINEGNHPDACDLLLLSPFSQSLTAQPIQCEADKILSHCCDVISLSPELPCLPDFPQCL